MSFGALLIACLVFSGGWAGGRFAEAAQRELPEAGLASSRIPVEHWRQYSDLALQWMQEYLRIDTTNPPGK
jgi:hypothetical protein